MPDSATLPDLYLALGLPERFHLNLAELRQRYFMASRETHPDLFAQLTDMERDEKLQASAQANTAYQTLSHPDSRLEYLLRRYGMLDSTGQASQAQLSAQFLMEMMEYNERIEDLANALPGERAGLEAEIAQLLADKDEQIGSLMHEFDASELPDLRKAVLARTLSLHLERRYLLRLRENLAKFASLP